MDDVGGQEEKKLPAHVEAMLRLSPKNEAVRRAVSPYSELFTWTKTKFGYEEALLAAFTSLVEKDVNNELAAQDLQDTIEIFRWISECKPLTANPQQREILLSGQNREKFKSQINALKNMDISPEVWKKPLLGFFRSHLRTLMDHKIISFPDLKIGDPHLGSRYAENQEKFKFFEDKIRKLATKK